MNESRESAAASSGSNTKVAEQGQKWVSFRLNETDYAVPASAVDQIIQKTHSTALPNSTKYLLGITPIRGEIAALIDLRSALGESPSPSTRTKTLVLKTTATGSAMRLAFDVDRLGELRTLRQADLRPAEKGAGAIVAGQAGSEGSSLKLLNCSGLVQLLLDRH